MCVMRTQDEFVAGIQWLHSIHLINAVVDVMGYSRGMMRIKA